MNIMMKKKQFYFNKCIKGSRGYLGDQMLGIYAVKEFILN